MRRRLLAIVLLTPTCIESDLDDTLGSTTGEGPTSEESGSSTTATSGPVVACEPTTAGIYAAVFSPNCSTPGCHAGNHAAVGLDLSVEATIETELVGIPSACDGSPLVVPGDAEASLLYQKLMGTQSCGAAMPVSQELDAELVDCVAAWIEGVASTCEQCGGATCVDTKVDPLHCGACGVACPPGVACVDGECACPSEATLCEGACVDTASDPLHCGGCDLPCDMFCLMGECAADCGALEACDGACVDVSSNPLHCGGCDQPCADGMTCVDSSCVCEAEVVSFAERVEPLLAAACTAMGCHGFPAPKEDLDLRTGNSYGELVGIASNQCGDRLLVAPGDPANSYLIDKLRGVDLCFGTKMPKIGQVQESDILAIAAWICHGAPDN
jgi:hypothetical protein